MFLKATPWATCLVLLCTAQGVQAQQAGPSASGAVAPDADEWAFQRLAGGASLGWQLRSDVGHFTRTVLTPELVVQGYVSTPVEAVFLRFGVRVGYGTEQAESPSSLRFHEHDIATHFTAAVLWDWWVVPSLTLGMGPLVRMVDVTTQPPVDPNHRLDHATVLFSSFLQAGVGFPIAEGVVMLEPYARYEWIPADDRISARFGADVTVSW